MTAETDLRPAHVKAQLAATLFLLQFLGKNNVSTRCGENQIRGRYSLPWRGRGEGRNRAVGEQDERKRDVLEVENG